MLSRKILSSGQKKSIVIDPDNQMGQAIIEHTNILTENIYSMYKAGESKDMIAYLYNIEIHQLNDVIRFYAA